MIFAFIFRNKFGENVENAVHDSGMQDSVENKRLADKMASYLLFSI